MQAVILAAGMGTRMGELTRNTPKPLLKIQDRTLLEHNLTAMPDEIDEVILVVGYLADQIKSAIGENFLGKKITYVSQTELKGTGHALSLCKGMLKNHFLVIMGDDLYYEKDLKALTKHHLATLVWEVTEADFATKQQAGIVKVDEKMDILGITERQTLTAGALVNAGAYIINTDYFNYPLVSAGNPATEYGLPQTFMQMVNGSKIKAVKAEWWHKVATPEDLQLNGNHKAK